jgi:hypothetical protein
MFRGTNGPSPPTTLHAIAVFGVRISRIFRGANGPSPPTTVDTFAFSLRQHVGHDSEVLTEGVETADWLHACQGPVQTANAGKDYRRLHARWQTGSLVSVETFHWCMDVRYLPSLFASRGTPPKNTRL